MEHKPVVLLAVNKKLANASSQLAQIGVKTQKGQCQVHFTD